jgi:PIN domain nuclease of toxin-antitoxin system
MTYLLDTHYMLWALTDPRKLSVGIKDVLTNPKTKLL